MLEDLIICHSTSEAVMLPEHVVHLNYVELKSNKAYEIVYLSLYSLK